MEHSVVLCLCLLPVTSWFNSKYYKRISGSHYKHNIWDSCLSCLSMDTNQADDPLNIEEYSAKPQILLVFCHLTERIESLSGLPTSRQLQDPVTPRVLGHWSTFVSREPRW